MKKSYENGYWSKITYWTCKLNEATHFNNLEDTQVAIKKLEYFTQKQAELDKPKDVTDVTEMSKMQIVNLLVKEFGKSEKAYYGTSSNAAYWTWNKTLRHYLDLKENFVYDYDTKLLTRVKLNGIPY